MSEEGPGEFRREGGHQNLKMYHNSHIVIPAEATKECFQCPPAPGPCTEGGFFIRKMKGITPAKRIASSMKSSI